MSPVKNHALLLHAFADAFAENLNVRLRLAGDGPLRAELAHLADQRGVAARVDFLGTLSSEQLHAEMTDSDAFVLASDVESFGVVVIEAQAAGLPVVCTASGGPDHLIDRPNGVLVPRGDRAALARAMAEMHRNIACYDRAAIRTQAVKCFGPERFVQQFEALAP
jgi:glycosyltransferase involved in cell wall biosynthesis